MVSESSKCLCRVSREVCIYEAWDQWKVRGGALGLAAGARILRRLGLGEALAEAANQVEGFRLHFHADGRELNSLNLPACTATWWLIEMVGNGV